MFASRLFWKLFAATAAVNLAAALLFAIVTSRWQVEELADQVDQRLRATAVLLADGLAEEIAAGRNQALQERIRELGAESGVRITLIDLPGEVVADSAQPNLEGVARMVNHEDRPEVLRAIARGEGLAEHRSASQGVPYRYFAARADIDGKPVGVVRTSLPRLAIDELISAKQRTIWNAASAIFLAALGISSWLIGRTIEPLREIDQAVDSMSQGKYQYRTYVPGRDELGQLALKLNRLGQEFDCRITQLTESHERQATVLGGMIEGVIAVDRRERVLFANAAAGRLFEFRPTLVEGRRLLEVVRNHTLEEAVSTALMTRQPQRLETTQEGSDKMSVAIQATPLPGDPCPGVVIVMHETTELRRLESLRRDFVANVSHELKTPLSSIKAYAETLRNGALDDRSAAETFVERIQEQAERLHHLILDMLSLARIESAQEVFQIEPVSIAEVVEGCFANYGPAAATKQIDLVAEPQDQGCFVRADKEGLREILDNLIDNAIKYTPQEGRVIVRWRDTHDRRLAEIEVEDSGIGISADEMPRVFERFYRVDKARSRELGGTGLGLAIVKHLAQSFGGTVSATSEIGRGSLFRVVLPLAQTL